MSKTQNVRISRVTLLPSIEALDNEMKIPNSIDEHVLSHRKKVENILSFKDSRLMIIAGPCSVHNPEEILEYGRRLTALHTKYQDKLFIVMRAYYEKPRSGLGWKGLISDPYLNGSCDMVHGLNLARKSSLSLVSMGLPLATEAVDVQLISYVSRFMSWVCVGARTSESQPHREMASGLSMPVGFKNGMDGTAESAINAVHFSRNSHKFFGVTHDGRLGILTGDGNPFGHVVLRGGKTGPNYHNDSVMSVARGLPDIGVVIDSSHGNSGKDYRKQGMAFREVLRQKIAGKPVVGIMLESNLYEGKQPFKEGCDVASLRSGVSITDSCIGWKETEALLAEAYNSLPLS